jgi:hypothetical protein
MKSTLICVSALLCACSPQNVPTDATDSGIGETGDTQEVAGPSFVGVWKAQEMRFEIRDGGFDENGNAIPEGQDYQATLPGTDFCIESWHLTVLINLKATFRVKYVNSSECTGEVEKADYVEESQWMVDETGHSIYVYPTQVSGDATELPDPYYLSFHWYSGDAGFDLGVNAKDFDNDGAEDDSQFLMYWRDLDG